MRHPVRYVTALTVMFLLVSTFAWSEDRVAERHGLREPMGQLAGITPGTHIIRQRCTRLLQRTSPSCRVITDKRTRVLPTSHRPSRQRWPRATGRTLALVGGFGRAPPAPARGHA